MIKKLLVAVLAMAMVIGTMAVSAFAADGDTYNVAGVGGLCGVDWDPSQNQMNDNGDGTWSIEFKDIKAGTYEFKVATNGAWDNGEYNLEGSAGSGASNASVTVEADGSTVVVGFDGEKATVEVVAGTADAPADDTPAGDSTAVMGYVVAAVVALAAVVTVISKKRSVEA